MTLAVLKFGGNSISTVEKISCVAAKISKFVHSKCKVIVAVSAMQNETNRLIDLVNSVMLPSSQAELAEYDSVLAAGEQVSSGLLALSLQKIGISARSWTAFQCSVIALGPHANGRVSEVARIDAILNSFQYYDVAVVTGFQGIDINSERIVTLGRGGTDASAISLAVASSTKQCYMYKDVGGVYTADPHVCKNARKISRITYEEMLEMSICGSAILQIGAVEMAMRHKVSVYICSQSVDDDSTLLCAKDENIPYPLITSIVHDRHDAMIAIYNITTSALLEQILSALKDKNIDIKLSFQCVKKISNYFDIFFTTSSSFSRVALSIINDILKDMNHSEARLINNIVRVSIICLGSNDINIVLDRIMLALQSININAIAIKIHEARVSLMIMNDELSAVMLALHDELF